MSESICAVVVTYNRQRLLRECLQALIGQIRAVDEILVLNNASQDGTQRMLEREFPQVCAINLRKNIGGAGGFHEGIKLAYGKGHDWMWLMDDDTIPEISALEELESSLPVLQKLDKEPILLASKVVWIDGELHWMNTTVPFSVRTSLFVKALEQGYMLIRSASFASMLLSRDAISKYGLPYKDFFIWNDDLEYSSRVLRTENGYLVPKSVAVHKTQEQYAPLTSTGSRFYYEVRNKIWLLKTSSFTWKEKIVIVRRLGVSIRYYLRSAPITKGLITVSRGFMKGVLESPKE